MIGIINYGMGNLASVQNALNYIGVKAVIVSEPHEMDNVKKIILPGVGAFGTAIDNLKKIGFYNKIREDVLVKNKPIIGICLGMQLLLNSSTEYGFYEGLHLIEGTVDGFTTQNINHLPIPHVGWNTVKPPENSILFKGITELSAYYFVHSFYCKIHNLEAKVGVTDYGIDFHSTVEYNNIFGCQFHPEKSQSDGLQILKNFSDL
ncbi:MAG: imidazole glycerol phosphate synthase subunit HisH [Chitinophaga sp.]|jgi:glutamine amidotransferase|nr:imidazole glycerol phosphate synthase subunit HisH [Chitinophaga sp.]